MEKHSSAINRLTKTLFHNEHYNFDSIWGGRRHGGCGVALFARRGVDEPARSLAGPVRRHRACGGAIGGGAFSLLLSLSP